MTLEAKSNVMYKVIQKDLGLHGEYKQMEWYAEKLGTKIVEGFQLRYIYVLDNNFHIAVPIIPFSKIDELGAGMYKGKKISIEERKRLGEICTPNSTLE